MDKLETQTIDGYHLVLTCRCSPEQYDVFAKAGDTETVGYIRVRWGHVSASTPNYRGEMVYSADTDGFGDLTSEERKKHLTRAVQAIQMARGQHESRYPGGGT